MSTEMVSADSLRRVAVLGAGTMGHGIAQVAALAGCEVALRDLDAAILEKAQGRIEANLDKGVEKGKVTPEARKAALERLRFTVELEDAVDSADAVIEAAPEKLALKHEGFAEVVPRAPAIALLATNTSSLAIGSIAAGLPEAARPRLVGMHFFNPVHIMKLVEVVRGDETADEAVACARGLAERMQKSPITVRDVPGFASSRLGLALGLEAMRMVEEGVASAEDIDKAMKLGYGHPMGPLELTDLVGLDVRLAIADYLADTLGERFRPPSLLRDKVSRGELGKKSGGGFY